MKVLELIRLEKTEFGVVSILRINKEIFSCALEPPDKNNAADISCIPAGQYFVLPVQSPKFGNTFTVSGVPNRSNILFHAGNTKEDTHGCILLGETIGKLKGERAVLNSGATFKRFLDLLSGERKLPLTIIESY